MLYAASCHHCCSLYEDYILPYAIMTGKIGDIASADKDLCVVLLLTAIGDEVMECLEMACRRCHVEQRIDREQSSHCPHSSF